MSGPPTSPEYLPLHVAEAEGYFAEAGLQVTLRTVKSEAAAAEALARQQVDLAATSLEAALRFGAAGTGQPPRLVFGLSAAPPVILAAATGGDAPIRSVRDLARGPVGISSPGAPEQTWLLALLARADLRPTDVSLRSYGERGLGPALLRGEVRAAMLGEPLASRLLAEGRAIALADFRNPQHAAQAIGPATVHAAVFESPRGRLQPADLEALSRALLRATARLRTGPPEELAARLPPAAVGRPGDFADRLAGTTGSYLRDGLVEPDVLEASVDLVRDHVPIPRAVRIPRIADMLRMEPLRSVLTSGR